jgi:hypothetical protein
MEDVENYDYEYTGEEYCNFVKGFCPHCQKWYRWVEVFTFCQIEDFEEG